MTAEKRNDTMLLKLSLGTLHKVVEGCKKRMVKSVCDIAVSANKNVVKTAFAPVLSVKGGGG